MTFGFVLLTAGAVMLLAGVNNVSIPRALRGAVGGPGPGEIGFTALRDATTRGTNMVTSIVGDGKIVTFDGTKMCSWIADELKWARRNGWSGGVSSGYRSKADQRRVCAEVPPGTPCASPGASNHQGKAYPGCAVDVTDSAGLDRVLSKKRGRKLKWTGRSISDDPHFSSGLSGV